VSDGYVTQNQLVADIADEIRDWSTRNFPRNTPEEPLLGMGEELGEIKHALLKIRQGIRGTPDELRAELADAIGDFIIFMLDYTWRREIDVSNMLEMAYTRALPPELYDEGDAPASWSLAFLSLTLGQLELAEAHDYASTKYTRGKLVHMWQALINFTLAMKFCLSDVVEETWAQVKQRDWTKHQKTGVPESATS